MIGHIATATDTEMSGCQTIAIGTTIQCTDVALDIRDTALIIPFIVINLILVQERIEKLDNALKRDVV